METIELSCLPVGGGGGGALPCRKGYGCAVDKGSIFGPKVCKGCRLGLKNPQRCHFQAIKVSDFRKIRIFVIK